MAKLFRILSLFLSAVAAVTLHGQNMPQSPVSARVTGMMIINPAAAGSKDFAPLDFSMVALGESSAQTLSYNLRFKKEFGGFRTSPQTKEFSSLGAGALMFREKSGDSESIGFSGTVSWHLPLDREKLSFISFGLALKGIWNNMDSVAPDGSDEGKSPTDSFIPNGDAGIYYYSPALFAGVSVTNILGSPDAPDTTGNFNIPLSRQYFITAGYKITLNRPMAVVLEPWLTVNLDDSLSFEPREILEPGLKIYMDNFCFGSYIHDFSRPSFFFQYKFPSFYIGTLMDFPIGTAFYKNDLTIELSAGINLSPGRSGGKRYWHW